MKLGLRGVIGILLSAVLLVYALRDVSFAVVWGVLRASDPWLFAAATVTGTVTFALRARRWRTILEPVVPNIPFGPL